MLAATASSSYYISQTILSYLSYDVVTLVKNAYIQPAEFPTVTFCNYYSGSNGLDDLKNCKKKADLAMISVLQQIQTIILKHSKAKNSVDAFVLIVAKI